MWMSEASGDEDRSGNGNGNGIDNEDENENAGDMECVRRRDEPSIGVLGTDQMLAILQRLPVQSVLAFGMTCKRHREVSDSDALWMLICRREWGTRAVDAWPVCRHKLGWKRLYRQMLILGAASWTRVRQGQLRPPPRASHSMNAVAGQLVVFGGGCDGGRDLDDTWVASLPDDPSHGVRWRMAGCGTPSGRFGHSCSVIGDALVGFGGINDKAVRHNDAWVFIAGVDGRWSWNLLEGAPSPTPPPRGAHAACQAGDGDGDADGIRMVVFGGIGSDGVRLGDTWVLDLRTGIPEWREIVTPVAPPARSGHSLTWVGGKRVILFGGRGVRFEVMNDVWVLDMEGEWPTWVELSPSEARPPPDFPAPRAGHSATLIFGGRILIFGGEDARRCRKSDVWVLDPAVTPQSTTTGCMSRSPEPGGSRLCRRFWKKLKQWGAAPSKRSFHAACAVNSGNAILIFGGMVDGELIPQAATGLGFDAELHLLQLVP